MTRRPLRDQPAAHRGDRDRDPLAGRAEAQPLAAGLPGREHPVEVEGDARDRRVVGGVVRLLAIDLRDPRQRAIRHQQTPRRPGHAALAERAHQPRQRVGIQRRIAAARQHQVALHHPARDRARPGHLRRKPVVRSQRVERIERRHDLRHRRRRPPAIRLEPLDQRPGLEIDQREPGPPRQPRRRQDRVDRLPPPPPPPAARAPPGKPRPPASSVRRSMPSALIAATPRAPEVRRREIEHPPAHQRPGRWPMQRQRRRLRRRQSPPREPLRRRRQPGAELVARPRQHAHRHRRHDLRPAAPVVEAREVVRPHQPHEMHPAIARLQRLQRRRGIARAEPRLEVGHPHPGMPHDRPRRRQPPLQIRRRIRLQRIARRDQPPDLIEPERLQRPLADMHMPRMRRIERPAQKSDPLAGGSMRSPWQHLAIPAFSPAPPIGTRRRHAVNHGKKPADAPPPATFRAPDVRNGRAIVAFSEHRCRTAKRNRCKDAVSGLYSLPKE